MKKLLAIILMMVAGSLYAESQVYFAYGFNTGLRHHDRHTYIIVDYDAEVLILVNDWDNDWRLYYNEVHIFSVTPDGDDPWHCTWEVDGLRVEINGHRATAWVEDQRIQLKVSERVFVHNY